MRHNFMHFELRTRCAALFLLSLVAFAPLAAAQGVQTGTVSGTVRSSDRLPLPGVTVVATSPALQGTREAVSDANGVYYLQGLAAGTYRVAFDLSGFQSAAREEVAVNIGALATVDAMMSPA